MGRKQNAFNKTSPEKQGAIIRTQWVICLGASLSSSQFSDVTVVAFPRSVLMGVFPPLKWEPICSIGPAPQLMVELEPARHG